MKKLRIYCGVLVLLLLPFGASAGMLMVGRSTDAATPAVVDSGRTQIDRGRVRTESEQYGTQIFRADRQVMWDIDPKTKTYREITRQDLERMAGQGGSELERARAQMQKLPPEQRKMFEQMMQHLPGGGPMSQVNITYKKARAGGKAGRWTCDSYDGYRGAEKHSEVCVVERQQLGMSAEDFQTLQQMHEFIAIFASSFGFRSWLVGPKDWQKQGGFPGVAVRHVVYDGAKPDSTFEVTETRSQSFPDSLFEVPAGFKKQTTR